jgi:hypothetical protein
VTRRYSTHRSLLRMAVRDGLQVVAVFRQVFHSPKRPGPL